MLVWNGLQHSATGTNFALRINNNSGNAYAESYYYFTPSASPVNTGQGTYIGGNGGFPSFGESATSADLWRQVQGFFLLDNYASSTKVKGFKMEFAYRQSTGGYDASYVSNGVFNSTSAVTSLDIVRLSGTATISNATNTTIRLYGVS
jgi:hypothetical protein